MKIGIEINSNTICGVLVCEGVVLATLTEQIQPNENLNEYKRDVINKLFLIINSLFTPKVKSIGISLLTTIHPEKGIVYHLDKIPHWKYFKIKTIVEEMFHVPTSVDSDLNCFLLGEKHHGSCKKYKDIISITLDSSIGSSKIANNLLYVKEDAKDDCPPCLSKRDCNWVDKNRNQYIQILEQLSLISTAFSKEIALPNHLIWENIGVITGRLISVLLENFTPQVVVLGGELATSYDHYINTVHEYIRVFKQPHANLNIPIISGKVKNVKAIGAAYL